MHTIKRRKLGRSLIVISVFALIAFIVVTFVRGQWHYEGGDSSGIAVSNVYSIELGVSGYYLIPILLCGALGLLLLAWPSQKPPKLRP